MDKLMEKYVTENNKIHAMAGLAVAQAICSRKLLGAKNNESREVVLEIMADIIKFMEEIEAQ